MEEKNKKKHIPLRELEVYQLARELSKTGWEIYQGLDWRDKKIMGDQFITAVDSFGANIVEGYKRYHYLDKIKFFYNSRASLAEASDYWLELLKERNKVKTDYYKKFKNLSEKSSKKLQNFINSIYRSRNNVK